MYLIFLLFNTTFLGSCHGLRYTLVTNEGDTSMTKSYAQRKLALLIKDHNHYIKVGYDAAVKDYRTAIDMLISVATRQGIKMHYTVTADGYINK